MLSLRFFSPTGQRSRDAEPARVFELKTLESGWSVQMGDDDPETHQKSGSVARTLKDPMPLRFRQLLAGRRLRSRWRGAHRSRFGCHPCQKLFGEVYSGQEPSRTRSPILFRRVCRDHQRRPRSLLSPRPLHAQTGLTRPEDRGRRTGLVRRLSGTTHSHRPMHSLQS